MLFRSYVSSSLSEQFRPVNTSGHVYAPWSDLYAPSILEQCNTHAYCAIGWMDGGWFEGRGNGTFIGRLSCPVELVLSPERVVMKEGVNTLSL